MSKSKRPHKEDKERKETPINTDQYDSTPNNTIQH